MRIDPTFDPKSPETWNVTLTVAHVAAIYNRTVEAVKHACRRNRFHPMPYKTKPYLWRRADVERDVFGARGGLRVAS